MERAASETARKSIASFSLGMMGRQAGNSPGKEDSEASGVHACEVCGACFETKRGLSSHARSHLRQLGVAVSDSSGAPIDLLYHLIQERDGKLPFPTLAVKSPKTPSPKKDSGTKLKIKISNLVKNKYSKSEVPVAVRTSSTSGGSSCVPEAVKPLKVPAKLKKVPGSCSPLSVSSALPSLSGSPTASLSLPSSKPLWAPQETDAPLNLTAMTDASSRDDVHVCELCGAWYETRKGLSSHARAHLRQFGVEMDAKGAPIEVLHELLQREDVQAKASLLELREVRGPGGHSPTSSPSTAASGKRDVLPVEPETPPPSKKSKTSLSSTSSSPSSGVGVKSNGRVSATPRVPKARKGSRTVVSKPKEEPVEVVLSTSESPRPRSTSSPFQTWPGPSTNQVTTAPKPEAETAQMVRCDYCSEMFDSRKALSCHARAHLRQLGVKWSPNASPIDTLYELMLREGTYQGSEVKVEVSPSPGTAGSWRKPSSSPRTFTPSPIDLSVREKTDSSDSVVTACEATCELCGFDFENRKALASHARAHLRQQGVDWRTNGSPIETLSMWMQREPGKVAKLHKRYMQGDLPHVKKRAASSPYPSSDAESSRHGTNRPSPGPSLLSRAAGREVKAGASQPSFASSHRKVSGQRPASHSSNIPTRLPRGCERRPPKHLSHIVSRGREAGPLKPPRAGNAPSLMPRPPESSLVKLVGKVYSLKCRFCEEVFKGPLSVQEDWLIHLRQHILTFKQDSAPIPAPTSQSTSIPAPTSQSTSIPAPTSQSTSIPAPTSQSTPFPSLILSDTPQLIGPQAV